MLRCEHDKLVILGAEGQTTHLSSGIGHLANRLDSWYTLDSVMVYSSLSGQSEMIRQR